VPLVYVHGIANRMEHDGYAARNAHRDQLFRRFLLPAPDDSLRSPHWGDLAGKLRWNGDSFPSGVGEPAPFLGLEDDFPLATEAALTEGCPVPDRLLVQIAARDLSDAVDLLYSAGPEADDELAVELAAFAGRVTAYLNSRELAVPDPRDAPRYPWLADAQDDTDLIDQLFAAIDPGPGTLGVGGSVRRWLNRARRRLHTGAAAVAGSPGAATAGLLRLGMPAVTATVVGDIFAYLGRRGDAGSPGPIVQRVADALEAAAAERTPDRPLVVVAHSLGGVITYDLLTSYLPGLVVDRLVTVGSQVGLFEELGLFHASDPAVPNAAQRRVAAPKNVGAWLNVVDKADPLAFRAEPIFDAVTDYVYPSGALWAHGAYLRQPRFHDRLAARLAQLPA
jgi:hypothetical protein